MKNANHGHTGRCGTDRDVCLLAYARDGDIHRDDDFEYRVIGNDRQITVWVYSRAEEEAPEGVTPWLTLTYDGRVGLTAAGRDEADANAVDAGLERPAAVAFRAA